MTQSQEDDWMINPILSGIESLFYRALAEVYIVFRTEKIPFIWRALVAKK